MRAAATWYFDFVSPYAYLQSAVMSRHPELATVEPRPVLFAGLLNHWEHKGPAEIAPKRIHTYRQVTWLAHRHDVRLKLPSAHPFNPLPLLRLSIALGNSRDVIDALFRFVWVEGHLPSDDEPFEALCTRLGVDDPQAEISRPDVKDALRRNTEEAISIGVFGVPTLAIEGELFWGFDMTEAACERLRGDAFFASAAMKRAASLPDGIHRSAR